ncbi:uncharacterized protein M421DRAFT_295547 [Didymella exigua CBS 183.55]|uniref:Uncharacterized protein n=1 Tax=Didymella exigua CBS 183.55 TaxID=1150837 RepID=A0A6A5RF48_9PLEO|nr:uncharacterized protein M421DRAFT_295547 [Didymella exigua CBS 183.55]KAF1924327.1 hypothetical protein M421DRAFT_295547 [Didymella exigua CBS 183.55]
MGSECSERRTVGASQQLPLWSNDAGSRTRECDMGRVAAPKLVHYGLYGNAHEQRIRQLAACHIGSGDAFPCHPVRSMHSMARRVVYTLITRSVYTLVTRNGGTPVTRSGCTPVKCTPSLWQVMETTTDSPLGLTGVEDGLVCTHCTQDPEG